MSQGYEPMVTSGETPFVDYVWLFVWGLWSS